MKYYRKQTLNKRQKLKGRGGGGEGYEFFLHKSYWAMKNLAL